MDVRGTQPLPILLHQQFLSSVAGPTVVSHGGLQYMGATPQGLQQIPYPQPMQYPQGQVVYVPHAPVQGAPWSVMPQMPFQNEVVFAARQFSPQQAGQAMYSLPFAQPFLQPVAMYSPQIQIPQMAQVSSVPLVTVELPRNSQIPDHDVVGALQTSAPNDRTSVIGVDSTTRAVVASVTFCRDNFAGNCTRESCKFAHLPPAYLPVPEKPCVFWERNKCTRARCPFLHGTVEECTYLMQASQCHLFNVDNKAPINMVFIAGTNMIRLVEGVNYDSRDSPSSSDKSSNEPMSTDSGGQSGDTSAVPAESEPSSGETCVSVTSAPSSE